MWDQFQLERLALERGVLEENHRYCVFSPTGDIVIVKIRHSVDGSWYQLRVEVPDTYPDKKPKVYIDQPVPLPAYWPGRKISEFAPSHNYHVLSTSVNGEVQICHFSDSDWDASKSIHLVVLKAKLWLQAYGEHHMKTGQPICDFFNDCR